MAFRVGIDMDGTLADLASAYHEVGQTMFGSRVPVESDASIEEGEQEETLAEARAVKIARHEAREGKLIWQQIRRTEDFWLRLLPIEPGTVARLYEVSVRQGWETFFITQRPATAGQTVQRQTQEWLVRQGFPTPSVLTLRGGRGKAAAAFELDTLIDDLPKNCVDAVSDSTCRPILILRTPSAITESAAKRMGIHVMPSVAEAITWLETPRALAQPGFVRRMLNRLSQQ